MKLSLNERLSYIFGAPLPSEPIFEATFEDPEDDMPPSEAIPRKKNPDTNIGDKRLGVNRYWVQYNQYVKGIEATRDAAKQVGLDQKFRQIVQSAIKRGVDTLTEENPITIDEAFKIARAILASKITREIEDRQRGSKGGVDPEKLSPELRAAYDTLKADAKGDKPSWKALIYGKWDGSGYTIYYHAPNEDGKQTRFQIVMENDQRQPKRLRGLIKCLERKGYLEQAKKLRAGYEARLAILQHLYPDATDSQLKYTAINFAVNSIGVEVNERVQSEEKQAPEYNSLFGSEDTTEDDE